MAHDEEFIEYAQAQTGRLRNLAYLMCADWHQAQDLTQQTLVKVYLAWPRIRSRDSVDAYARQVMLRELLTEKRRRRSTERSVANVPDRPSAPDQADLRLTLIGAIGQLPPKRRAVIVLRYWEDNSVETVAKIMRMTPSAVKSLTARALQDLRTEFYADLPAITP